MAPCASPPAARDAGRRRVAAGARQHAAPRATSRSAGSRRTGRRSSTRRRAVPTIAAAALPRVTPSPAALQPVGTSRLLLVYGVAPPRRARPRRSTWPRARWPPPTARATVLCDGAVVPAALCRGQGAFAVGRACAAAAERRRGGCPSRGLPRRTTRQLHTVDKLVEGVARLSGRAAPTFDVRATRRPRALDDSAQRVAALIGALAALRDWRGRRGRARRRRAACASSCGTGATAGGRRSGWARARRWLTRSAAADAVAAPPARAMPWCVPPPPCPPPPPPPPVADAEAPERFLIAGAGRAPSPWRWWPRARPDCPFNRGRAPRRRGGFGVRAAPATGARPWPPLRARARRKPPTQIS